jgi:LEA14-like dessication related protein
MEKSAKIKITIVIITTILIVTGLTVYSYNQLSVSLYDVKFLSIDWEPITWSSLLKLGLETLSGNWFDAAFDLIQGINLNLVFSLTNKGLVPVYIPNLSYDVLINDIHVTSGNSKIDTIISPGQTKEIESFQSIQKSSLSPAIYSIVGAQGVMDIKVNGTAHFKLLGLDIPVPFESSKQISIYDEIRNKLDAEIQKNKPQQSSFLSSVGSILEDVLSSVANELFGSKELDFSLHGQSIMNDTFKINPGSYHDVPFTLQCTANLHGGFNARAFLDNSIIVYIFDKNGFEQYQGGHGIFAYYDSTKVGSGIFDVILSPGRYHIVMSNVYSDFSTKTVQLQAAASCV